MSADKNKVLIVEDKVEIASRIKSAVEQSVELEVSGVAGDVDTGLKYLFERKPRIVLVDLGLPDGSGVEIINAVAQTDWKCDALVISIFGDEARVIEALQAGAKGYLLKSGSMQSIGEDVKSVIEGGSPISPQIARHLLEMVRQSSTSPDNDKIVIELTSRETEILNAVAKGYKRREIGEKLGISTGTVGNHINNIYQKLNVGSNTEAIAQATRMGIL
ncbi:MAG: response regulator transcription factor [Lentilitoribacter sp.]